MYGRHSHVFVLMFEHSEQCVCFSYSVNIIAQKTISEIGEHDGWPDEWNEVLEQTGGKLMGP